MPLGVTAAEYLHIFPVGKQNCERVNTSARITAGGVTGPRRPPLTLLRGCSATGGGVEGLRAGTAHAS